MMKNHIQIEASREYKMINDNHIKTRKINWIESLRGVACIAVIIQHYFGTKFYYFNIGNFGVILYFKWIYCNHCHRNKENRDAGFIYYFKNREIVSSILNFHNHLPNNRQYRISECN